MLLGAATGCGTVRGRGVNEVDAGEAGTLAVGAVTHLTDARVLLVRRSDGLVAFSDRCPRDACVVRHRPDLDSPSVPALQPDGVGWLRCPCCGSSFTRDGGVNGPGPAPRPLDVHPVSVVAGRVLVTTTQRQERQRDTPPPVVGGHEDGSFTNW
jgi:Rieske Fe-S protein